VSAARLASLAALLLALPAAHAQMNKCADAKGKVTYQQDPCPGQVRTAPVPPPAAPSAATLQQTWTDIGELDRCADEWEGTARMMKAMRESSSGRGTASPKYVEMMMERFLPICGKYGFEAPKDAAAEQRNNAVAADLRRQSLGKRGQLGVAERTSSSPASQALQAQAREMEQCADDWDSNAATLQRNRAQLARSKQLGYDTARDEMLHKQQIQNYMSRFLPKCEKYGFEFPRDEAAEARNQAAALELRRKEGALRAQAKYGRP
jgi:hypothetical protein